MSRTYSKKQETKQRRARAKELTVKGIVIADYEIEFIEMSLGPSIRLQM